MISLRKIDVPADVILCSDHLCQCPAHSDFISIYYDDIVSYLVDAGDKCIPRCKPPGKRMPGWNDQARLQGCC